MKWRLGQQEPFFCCYWRISHLDFLLLLQLADKTFAGIQIVEKVLGIPVGLLSCLLSAPLAGESRIILVLCVYLCVFTPVSGSRLLQCPLLGYMGDKRKTQGTQVPQVQVILTSLPSSFQLSEFIYCCLTSNFQDFFLDVFIGRSKEKCIYTIFMIEILYCLFK